MKFLKTLILVFSFVFSLAYSSEKVVITFISGGNLNEKVVMEKSIRNFEKENNDIKVIYKHIPDSEYNTKLLTLLASENEPDVAYVSPKYAQNWYLDGKILNLYSYYKNDKDLNYNTLLNNVFYDMGKNQTIGTNSAVETFGIYYNENLFKEMKLKPLPSNAKNALTWTQFIDLAQTLTIDVNGKNAKDPAFNPKKISQYGFSMSKWMWSVFLNGNGGEWLSKDGKTTGLMSKESIDTIQKISDLINKYHVMPKPSEIEKEMQNSIAGILVNKRVAMVLGGQWSNFDLGNAVLKEKNFKYQIGVLPILNEKIGSPNLEIGHPTVIFSKTKYPKEAFRLIKWLSNPEVSIELYKNGLRMPLLKEYYIKKEKIDLWTKNSVARPSTFYEAMVENTVKKSSYWESPAHTVKNFQKQSDIIASTLDKIFDENADVYKTLKAIEPFLNKEVQGKYEKANQ